MTRYKKQLQTAVWSIALVLLISQQLHAQNDNPELSDLATVKVYYYGCAEKIDGLRKVLYITPLSYVNFYPETDYTDRKLNDRLEDQFIGFVRYKAKVEGLRFAGSKFSADKSEIEKMIRQETAKYKNMKYKVVKVKKFYFD